MTQKCLALLILIVLSLLPVQQTPAQQTEATLRTNSRLVQLDVVVTDRSGNQVTGLTKEDFSVFEDGARQQIASFEPPETHVSSNLPSSGKNASQPPSTGTATTNISADSRPETILVLDDSSTSSADSSFGWQMLLKYLHAQPSTLPEPAALMVLTKRRLERVASPTQDTAALIASARKIQLELPAISMENGVQGAADSMVRNLLALDEIALSSANRQSRKNIIWIGSGFPMLSSYDIEHADRDRLLSYVRYTANWMQETRTTLYTIDPRGLEVAETSSLTQGFGGNIFGSTGTLPEGELLFESLAPATGGKIYRNRNDINVAISNAVESGSTYYTLSYYPENGDFDGKFRKIRITVARPDVTATTQEGYYAVDEGFGATQSAMDFALSRAVTSPLQFSSVQFDAVGKVLNARPPSARLSVSVDRDGISWQPEPNGDQRGEITLVTADVARNQKILNYKVRELEIVMPQAQFADSSQRPLFYVTIPLAEKTEYIRFVLRDAASGRLGTYDVPRQSLGQQLAKAK